MTFLHEFPNSIETANNLSHFNITLLKGNNKRMLSEWMALTDIINKYAVSLPTKERQRIPLAAFMTPPLSVDMTLSFTDTIYDM